jgi:hypothetical protein
VTRRVTARPYVPAGTAAWRICRETSGRPSELKGTDKQLIRFPLDTTTDDLVELCGPGVYRVYGLDELANQLAHVATWNLTSGARELRNSAVESSLLTGQRTSTVPATDMRFVLEAMTHMMRTHTDALRIVTESHVDLAKAVVSAKGLPRNSAAMQLLSPAQPETGSKDDDDEDAAQPHWVELLMPLAEKAAEIVPGLLMARAAQGRSAAQNDQSGPSGHQAKNDDAELANRPKWEARDLVDFRYAARKGEAKRAAREQTETARFGMAGLQARVMADPALVQQLLAIKAQLAPDESETLMGAIAGTSEQERAQIIENIKALPLEGAVEFCRDLVKAIREHAERTA